MNILDITKNMTIHEVILDVTKRCIGQLVNKGYYGKADDFADDIGMSKMEFIHRTNGNTGLKMCEWDLVWNRIYDVDQFVYQWGCNLIFKKLSKNNENP